MFVSGGTFVGKAFDGWHVVRHSASWFPISVAVGTEGGGASVANSLRARLEPE